MHFYNQCNNFNLFYNLDLLRSLGYYQIMFNLKRNLIYVNCQRTRLSRVFENEFNNIETSPKKYITKEVYFIKKKNCAQFSIENEKQHLLIIVLINWNIVYFNILIKTTFIDNCFDQLKYSLFQYINQMLSQNIYQTTNNMNCKRFIHN